MASSKKRKYEEENRSFKEEWTQQYAFILPPSGSKPLCLICNESIALVKICNLKRHYDAKHRKFESMYPQKTEERKNKIDRLKLQYERSATILSNSMTVQEKATECSLRIAWILGKHKKPFTDSEIVKECMLETVETLFDDKMKSEIKEKIKKIPLSDSTSMRRTEILAYDLMSQLDEGLQNAPGISLAIDESTDKTDNAQVLVFVRYYNAGLKKFCQDLLGVANLKERTRGEDIYEALKIMLNSRSIDAKSIISVTTDGAPSMIGRGRGLTARLKEDNPDMINYHCIIHQSVLCASMGDEFYEVMETIMKLINFLRSKSALQHRLLRSFLAEVDANFDDLLLHNNVRWLSKGRVLQRFWAVKKELHTFLKDQDSVKAKLFLNFLEDDVKMETTGFLADIMLYLNDLNVKLQGKNHSVFNLISTVRSFQKKLEFFATDIRCDLLHFPKLLEQRKGDRPTDTKYVQFIEKLIDNFKERFNDFFLSEQLLLFIQDPFNLTNIAEFARKAKLTFRWTAAAKIQLEMIDLQENVPLKHAFRDCTPELFWASKVSNVDFPALFQLAVHILTMFGSAVA